MFVLGYTGCDPAAPAALYIAALMLTGATPAGVYASAADIAPNYAGLCARLSINKFSYSITLYRFCRSFVRNIHTIKICLNRIYVYTVNKISEIFRNNNNFQD